MTAGPPPQRLPAALSGIAILLLLTLVFSHTVAIRHVLMGILLLGLTVHFWRDPRPTIPLAWPVFAWLAYALASLVWSAAPVLSVRSWTDEAFYPLVLFVLFYRMGTDRDLDVAFVAALCAGMIALAALSAGGYASIARTPSRREVLYYYPGVGQASTYAVMALPIFLMSLLRARARLRAWAAPGALLSLVVGTVTLNRMFWPVAIVAAVATAYGAKPRWMARHAIKFGIAAAAIVLVILAGVHQARMTAFVPDPQSAEAPMTEQIEDMVTSDPRPAMWSAWFDFGSEHAWIGVGFGQRVPALYHWSQHFAHPIFRDRNQRAHAHNYLLNVFLQVGLVGVALLLWLLGALLWRFLRARERQPLAAWAGIALFAAMLLKNFTDDFMRDAVAMYFWALAGWLLARAERADAAQTPA